MNLFFTIKSGQVETVLMIKTKFSDALRSKTEMGRYAVYTVQGKFAPEPQNERQPLAESLLLLSSS